MQGTRGGVAPSGQRRASEASGGLPATVNLTRLPACRILIGDRLRLFRIRIGTGIVLDKTVSSYCLSLVALVGVRRRARVQGRAEHRKIGLTQRCMPAYLASLNAVCISLTLKVLTLLSTACRFTVEVTDTSRLVIEAGVEISHPRIVTTRGANASALIQRATC